MSPVLQELCAKQARPWHLSPQCWAQPASGPPQRQFSVRVVVGKGRDHPFQGSLDPFRGPPTPLSGFFLHHPFQGSLTPFEVQVRTPFEVRSAPPLAGFVRPLSRSRSAPLSRFALHHPLRGFVDPFRGPDPTLLSGFDPHHPLRGLLEVPVVVELAVPDILTGPAMLLLLLPLLLVLMLLLLLPLPLPLLLLLL